jgi:pimeloyl-ACP methyl ester carboxylesterase
VKVPTLLVRGAESDVVTDAGLADMKRLIPTAESIVVPHAGHMVAGDDNGLFVVGLKRFLDTVAQGQGLPQSRALP